ncbi:MAG: choline ABC transporter permease, partial [Acidobacteria bacterium]|nr:choline ABC transporter permease [Acidobacteriota bacterium]
MKEFFGFLSENWSELLVLTREHIFIVALSSGLAMLVGLPLGVLLTRVKSLQT